MSKFSRISDKQTNPLQKRNFNFLISSIKVNLLYIAIAACASIIVFLLIRPQIADDYQTIQTGAPSPRTIYAPFDFEFVDEISTQKQKEAEAFRINPVYQSHPQRIHSMISALQSLQEAALSIQRNENEELSDWVNRVMEQSGVLFENSAYVQDANADPALPKTAYECLNFYRSFSSFWNTLPDNINAAAGQGITDNITPIREAQQHAQSSPENTAVVIQIIDENGGERASFAGQEIFTFENFLQRFELQMSSDFPDKVKDYPAVLFSIDLVKTVYAGPSLTYNELVTQQRKQDSISRVNPIVRSVSKGEIIVGYNEIVTQDQLQIIQVMLDKLRISVPEETGYFILAVFFVLMITGYQYYFQLYQNHSSMPLFVILLCIIMIFVLSKVCAYLTFLDSGSFRFEHAEFGVPAGALGVILTVLFDPRLALFCCSITSLYLGFIFGGSTQELPVASMLTASITSWSAIYSITKIRQRSDLYRAGGIVIVMASVLIVTFTLFQIKELENISTYSESLKWSLLWGAINGCLVSILSISLLPILEDLLGMTTDIKLLELSQRNELLQKLEEEAPGSYQHTMRVATLAESAAEAIGANALLTRVGTYYHDIGKTVKPLYFVENQQTKADKARHSKLSTNMSCMIIRNHVKHGLEIAKQYKLPKAIMDFIPEHHGTTLMTYFYHEALAEQEKEGTVKEDDFRYPGPKPQSKETAIVMLSDALEASSRTLENVTEREIRQLVRKIINDRFMDGQFDECNLTLQDLHTLYQSFSESLLHTLHQRIVYPDKPSTEKLQEKISKLSPADTSIKNDETKKNKQENGESSEPKKTSGVEEEEKPVAIKQ